MHKPKNRSQTNRSGTMRSFLNTVKSRYDRTISERTCRLDPDVRRELADEVEAALNIHDAGGDGSSHHEAGASVSPGAGTLTGDEIGSAVAEIDEALDISRSKLAELERSEQFVGMRCRRYRLALEDRAAELDRLSRAAVTAEMEDENCIAPNNEEDAGAEEQEDVEGGGDGGGGGGGGGISAQHPRTAATPMRPPKSAQELAEMREQHLKDEQALQNVVATHRNMLADVERMRRTIVDLEGKRTDILHGRDMARDFLIAAAEAEELEAAGELQRGACPLTPANVTRGPGNELDTSTNVDDETRGTAESEQVSEHE